MFGIPNVDDTIADFQKTLTEIRDLLQKLYELEEGRDR